jgi:DNA-binding NarL/FixJ family response regulator
MPAAAPPSAVRVLVADASALLRAAAARVLEDAGFAVVAQAGDDADLLRKARAHAPDVAVVHDAGLDAVRALRRELPEVGLLLFSRHADEAVARELLGLGSGGFGYLVEGRVCDVTRFTDAVARVAAGGTALDDEVLDLVLRRRPDPRLDALSDRERAVLALLAEGRTNPAIARSMFLSERAVERHVTGIFAKLGLAASARVHRRVLAVIAHWESAGRSGGRAGNEVRA